MSLFYMEGILIQNFFITLSTYDKTWILPGWLADWVLQLKIQIIILK